MDTSTKMDNIISNINYIEQLEGNVDAFSQLSNDIKLELLDKLKFERTEIVGQFLNRIYTKEHDKQIQKIIKKLLFRLKTSGIKVEELRVEGESALKKYEEKRVHRGLMSNYDGDGTRLAVVAFEAKRNTYVLVHSLLHFSRGLLELGNITVDREGLGQIFTEYLKGSLKPFVIVEVAPRYAYYLIEEASSLSGQYADEIKQMKSFSYRLGGRVQKPSDVYVLPIPNDIESSSLDHILSNSLFEPFFVIWDTLEDDKKQFNDIGASSSIVLPPYLMEEKKQALIKNLIENGKLSPNLPFMKRLMEDYAYIFYTLGDFKSFKGLVDILQLSDGPYKMLSFFVKKALREEEKAQEHGLIINPYEQVHPQR
ncbi:MAG TPA: hypothetical protein PL032_08660 [Syntrophorhabdus sp.]|jgi:hypothetical protein|nr:hypothetical protein [Syntrophorhabdus sp.]HOH27035.1 hypothetical protein [Syntrophorhabdus sp.]HPW36783.1 hypothetical protein [Syntrophorhabdus sp.]